MQSIAHAKKMLQYSSICKLASKKLVERLPSSGQMERDKQEEEAAAVAATLNKKCFAKPEEVIHSHHTIVSLFKKSI